MATIYVLYINGNIVGQCLELIRKVCEPKSTSKPHVTVRGPIRIKDHDLPDIEQVKISHIDLLGPGYFFSEENQEPIQNTVFIMCDYGKLGKLYYKPEYMGSPPHVTLYDGDSREFAKKLLEKIKSYNWHIRITLDKHNKKQALTKIQLKRKTSKQKKLDNIEYTTNQQNLFKIITNKQIDDNYIINLNDEERLQIVDKIYNYLTLETNTQHYNRDSSSNETYNTDNSLISAEKYKPHRGPISKTKFEQLKLFENHQENTKQSKTRKMRNELGQFPTPPELAIEITKCIKILFPQDLNQINFGDPSTGTGSFFYSLMQVFGKKHICSAYGVEIDNTIASITQTLWGKQGYSVFNEDYFSLNSLPKRNLIICNPPYIRHHYIHKDQKKLLQQRAKDELGISVNGMASIYVYFLLISHQLMEDNAISAWLIPSEFMEVNYGKALRKYLSEKVTTFLIHRFDPTQVKFEGVMVTSSVVIFKKKKPGNNHKIRFTYGGSLLSPSKCTEVPATILADCEKWPENIGEVHSRPTPSFLLKDFFEIKRGIATGANSFFILPRDEARKLNIPEKYLKPILPSPKMLNSQIIDRAPDGYPLINTQLSLIDCDLPQELVMKKYPDMWDYFQKAEALGVRDRFLVKSRKLWYRQEQRTPPPFLCSYLGRVNASGGPFRFVWNRSDAVASNMYLLIYPKGELLDLIAEKPNKIWSVFELLSNMSNIFLRNGGRVYGGGLYKLEPRELGLLPADNFKTVFD